MWLFCLLAFLLTVGTPSPVNALPAMMSTGPGDGQTLDPERIDKDKVFLLIDKSNYRLYLYEDTRLLKTYKVVFGSNALTDKFREGDKKTPEGTFRVKDKHYDNRWNRFILLDYPNETSWTKFRQRKAKGLIPSNARIGGAIGIHGVRPGVQQAIDLRINWTDGCISMKNADVAELYPILQAGTPVVIQR